MEEEGYEGKLVFAVNEGEIFEVTGIHPSTTLLEFLRTQTPFKGAKLGCGEGDFFFDELIFDVGFVYRM